MCTEYAPFDCYFSSVHKEKYLPEICAHFLNGGAHLLQLLLLLSTLGTFCLYFMSKSVLIRSVHHFWPKMSDSAQKSAQKEEMSKQNPFEHLCAHCAHFLYFLCTPAMSTLSTPCTPRAHSVRHEHSAQMALGFALAHYAFLFQDPVGSARWPQVASCVSKERRTAKTQDCR